MQQNLDNLYQGSHISKWNQDISVDETTFTTREVAVAFFNYIAQSSSGMRVPQWFKKFLPTPEDHIYLMVWIGVLQGVWSHGNLPKDVEFPVQTHIHKITKDVFIKLSLSRVLGGSWVYDSSFDILIDSILDATDYMVHNQLEGTWYTPSEMVDTIAAGGTLDSSKLKKTINFYDQQRGLFNG